MRKKIVPRIMLALLLISMLTLSFNIQPAKSTENNWWNSDWIYRRQITISERSDHALIDFPIEVSINHDGHAQIDGRDIRVIENDTEIPYCITKINSTRAILMFEINLTSLSTKNICIYYGNHSASTPNYPLVPITISEGNTGHAVIDNSIYIGWDYTSWGWSNNVELWNDFRIDFNGNSNFTDDKNLITDYGSRQGGIGRFKRDIEATGLGEYQCYIQTPIYVDINFANTTLRVYRDNLWVETTQADFLWMYSPSWNYANCDEETEENIVDGIVTDPGGWNVIYRGKINPRWMALRDSSLGYVFSSIGIDIGINYNYSFGAKEMADWDRVIHYNFNPSLELEGNDQPPNCRIYWYADNSNEYSEINKTAIILSNPPTISVLSEEIIPEFPSTIILLPAIIFITLVIIIGKKKLTRSIITE